MESRLGLGIVTVFSVAMMGFPYYATLLYPKPNTVQQGEMRAMATTEFAVSGMTCVACVDHVSHTLAGHKGILKSEVSFERSRVVVLFDSTQTSVAEIQTMINSTGYSTTIVGGR